MRRTVLEIDLQRLQHNLEVFKKQVPPQTHLLANLKGNAYGMGALEIGKFLEQQNVTYFSVAYINEGIELRKGGIQTKILVFNPSPEHFQALIDYKLEPEVSSIYYLEKLLQFLEKNAIDNFPIHLKLDTGMHRAGIGISQIKDLTDLLANQKKLSIQSVFSHLAAAEDPAEDVFTQKQIDLFVEMTKILKNTLKIDFLRHLLNTAGVFRFPQAAFDMIRPGLGLFGYNLVEEGQKVLQPIAELKTKISQIKNLEPGETVGYSRNFTAYIPAKVALLPLGYADALPRKLGQGRYHVHLKNNLAPIVGNISMDSISINVSGIDCQPGDEVVVIDNQDDVYKIAELLGSIPYEVITNIAHRVTRKIKS